ncbi:flagellar motor switch protein FliN [Sinorhizobium meliloti]|nr:Flagellar motor switch protein [Sinorhizobium meliloti 2011]ASJ58290.1 flagellar motor switch protein FliN [Sinorhizobium meliloti]CAC45224.1 Flagellar motor switch protein [Sinorhizobium meliloti 1021]ASP50373.1 flagellar motor switch protein FliN [Sinorhizobium meliloti]ASP57676.1 flagellar motor switch protein FliN [Sinorhizobium meliloti]
MPEASFNWNIRHMAPKKAAPIAEPAVFAADAELDQAIDDLRGVLKKDGAADFGADFAAAGPLEQPMDFGSDFGSTDGAGFGGDFAAGFGGGLTETGAAGGFDAGSGFVGGDFDAAPIVGETAPGSGMTANMDLIMDIPIDVQIVLGTSRMQVSGLMALTEGATIALDRKIGEPVEIMVNGRVIGRGEITVLEGDVTRFGVKLLEIKGTKK